jgi:hypothetical protein
LSNYQKSASDDSTAKDPAQEIFGVPGPDLPKHIGAAASWAESDADRTAEKAKNPNAATPTPQQPPTSSSTSETGAALPGLPKTGGQELSQTLKDQFSPVVGNLDHIRVHDTPHSHAASAHIGAEGFIDGPNIHLGKNINKNTVIPHELGHIPQKSKKIRRKASSDSWSEKQNRIRKEQEAERERQRIAAEAERKRIAKLEADRKAAENLRLDREAKAKRMASLEKIKQKALLAKYGPDYQPPVKEAVKTVPYQRTDLSAIKEKALKAKAEQKQAQLREQSLKQYPGIQQMLKPPVWGAGAIALGDKAMNSDVGMKAFRGVSQFGPNDQRQPVNSKLASQTPSSSAQPQESKNFFDHALQGGKVLLKGAHQAGKDIFKSAMNAGSSALLNTGNLANNLMGGSASAAEPTAQTKRNVPQQERSLLAGGDLKLNSKSMNGAVETSPKTKPQDGSSNVVQPNPQLVDNSPDGKALRLAEARRKAKAIQDSIPSDTKNITISTEQNTGHYDYLQNVLRDAGKTILGKGKAEGLDQYFDKNSAPVSELRDLIRAGTAERQPGMPGATIPKFYKGYLEPAAKASDKVELLALKKDSIRDVVDPSNPESKTVTNTSNSHIVRAVTTTDANGKPVTEYFLRKDRGAPLNFQKMPLDEAGLKTEWLKINAPAADKVVASVNVTDITQGKKVKEINGTVNLKSGEEYTQKQYNSLYNETDYRTSVTPTFMSIEQSRGNAPRMLKGTDLRNEIGASLNFDVNNAPKTAQEQELAKKGNWDNFSPDKLPTNLQNQTGLTAQQKEQNQERFKKQHETIVAVEKTIQEVSGKDKTGKQKTPEVTTLPIVLDSPELGGQLIKPLYRVKGSDGADQFVDVDPAGEPRVYKTFQDWQKNNKLPAGRVSYFKDGQIAANKDGTPNFVTEPTNAVINTPGKAALHAADTGTAVAGAGLGIAAQFTPLGWAGDLALGASILWQGSRTAGRYLDRVQHGQSGDPIHNAEARSLALSLGADALDIFKNSNDFLNKAFKLISESISPISLYAKSSTSSRSS